MSQPHSHSPSHPEKCPPFTFDVPDLSGAVRQHVDSLPKTVRDALSVSALGAILPIGMTLLMLYLLAMNLQTQDEQLSSTVAWVTWGIVGVTGILYLSLHSWLYRQGRRIWREVRTVCEAIEQRPGEAQALVPSFQQQFGRVRDMKAVTRRGMLALVVLGGSVAFIGFSATVPIWVLAIDGVIFVEAFVNLVILHYGINKLWGKAL